MRKMFTFSLCVLASLFTGVIAGYLIEWLKGGRSSTTDLADKPRNYYS